MNRKLLCVLCGFATLALSMIYITTLNVLAMLGTIGFFIAFQILFWKFIRQK